MPVIIGGVSIRPAPLVSLSKAFQLTTDGRVLGSTVSARLAGTLVAEKVDDTFIPLPIEGRLSSILAKQAALRALFATNGQMFEVQGLDGSPPVKFNATVESIDFAEGTWVDKSDYTVVLRGEDFSGEVGTNYHCDSASESWQFDEGDSPRTRKATHTVTAKGRTVYAADGTVPLKAWERAKAFVLSQLGTNWATRTAAAWSPTAGEDLAGVSAVAPPTDAWNRVITETVDELDGTYSITETWVLSDDPWAEDYTVNVRRVDEPNVSTVVAISGTITGLRSTIGINTDKYTAALARWATVQTLLVSRCQDAATISSGGTLGTHPVAMNVDHNVYAGTVAYSFEYNDRLIIGDTTESYTVAKSVSVDNYKTVVRIEGVVTGVVYLDDGPSPGIKFSRALLRWDDVKSLIFARAVSDSGVPNLKAFPVTAQVSQDPTAGTISYTYEFDDRDPDTVQHEFTVSRSTSRSEGMDTVRVEGTITGLRTISSTNIFGTGGPAERYDAAVAYYTGISGNILGLVAQYVSLGCINPSPMATSVSYNPLGGTVSYSADYNSQLMPLTPGALTESVTIQDEGGTPVFALVPVPGEPTGPIFQDIGTIKERRRTVSVEIVMQPPKFGCSARLVTPPTFDVGPYAPSGLVVFVDSNPATWSPISGRFTQTVTWVYK